LEVPLLEEEVASFHQELGEGLEVEVN